MFTTYVGNRYRGYSGDGGLATDTTLGVTAGLNIDAAGNLYIVDTGNRVIRKVNPAGIISTLAGTCHCGYAGDGGPAVSATLGGLSDVTSDSAANVYITQSEGFDHLIRKISSAGVITLYAGTPGRNALWGGDGGLATSAMLSAPSGVKMDSTGNL